MQEKCDHRSGTYSTLNHNNAAKALGPPKNPGRIMFIELDTQMDAIRDLHSTIDALHQRLDCFMQPTPECPATNKLAEAPQRIVEIVSGHTQAIRYAQGKLAEILERLDV